MKTAACLLLAASGLGLHAADAGFTPLFNGRDLTGWTGNAAFWSVKDGAITGVTQAGESNARNSTLRHNTFLVYTNKTFSDFELRFSYKLPQGNSGVQYRSKVLQQGEQGPIVGGYQADFEAGTTYSGILYEERGRGILAQRGQVTILHPNPADKTKPRIEVVGGVGLTAELQANIKAGDWNDYVVLAVGNQLTHIINGRVTAMVVDEDAANAAQSGSIALQIHTGPPMTVQFRDIRVREMSSAGGVAAAPSLEGTWKTTQLVLDGNVVPAADLAEIELIIRAGGRFTVLTPDRDMTGALTHDAAARTMDVKMDDGEVRDFLAIYELDGDTLKICYGAGTRPKEFSSEPGSQRILAVYQRATR